MTDLSPTYHPRLAKCLATRDKAEAAALLAEVETALATGAASGAGFENDVIRLSAIAGVPLGKMARRGGAPMEKAAPRPELPPHLAKLATDAIARIENADGRLEKAAAIKHGQQVKQRLDDFWANLGAETAIRGIHRRPPSSGGF